MKAEIKNLKDMIISAEQEIINNVLSNDSLKTKYEELRNLRNKYDTHLLNTKEYGLLLRDKLDSIHFAELAIFAYYEFPACISIIGDFVMNCNHINLYINMYSNDRDDIYYEVIEKEAKVLSYLMDKDITKGYIIIDLNKELNRILNEINEKEESINEQ